VGRDPPAATHVADHPAAPDVRQSEPVLEVEPQYLDDVLKGLRRGARTHS